MALTANRKRTKVDGESKIFTRNFDVPASTEIFQGGVYFVDASTGALKKTSNGTTDLCVGIAFNHYNNAVASATTDKPVTIEWGQEEDVTITGVAATDVGKPVYSAADDSFTLSPTSAVRVGVVTQYVTTNTATVRIDPIA